MRRRQCIGVNNRELPLLLDSAIFFRRLFLLLFFLIWQIIRKVVDDYLVEAFFAGHYHRLSDWPKGFLGCEGVHVVLHVVLLEELIQALWCRHLALKIPGHGHDLQVGASIF